MWYEYASSKASSSTIYLVLNSLSTSRLAYESWPMQASAENINITSLSLFAAPGIHAFQPIPATSEIYRSSPNRIHITMRPRKKHTIYSLLGVAPVWTSRKKIFWDWAGLTALRTASTGGTVRRATGGATSESEALLLTRKTESARATSSSLHSPSVLGAKSPRFATGKATKYEWDVKALNCTPSFRFFEVNK